MATDTQMDATIKRCVNCHGPITPSVGKGRRRLWFCGTPCRLDHWQKIRSKAERLHLKEIISGGQAS